MPEQAPRTVYPQRRPTALFTIRNPRHDKYTIWLASGLALFAFSASGETTPHEFHGEKGQTYRCERHKISDGDTVVATCDRQKIHIRLAGIDAPEMGQTPYGEQSRAALAQRLPAHFDMHYLGQDYYHRSLGILYDINRDVNLTMIADGYAFAYAGKDTPPAYRAAEKQARAYRKGFWAAYKPPDNPKTWRRHHLSGLLTIRRLSPSPTLPRAPCKMRTHFAWVPARCGLRPAGEGDVSIVNTP